MRRSAKFVFSAAVFLMSSLSVAGVPVVPGFVVEPYVDVANQAGIAFGRFGELYVGNSTASGLAFVRRVCRETLSVVNYGNVGHFDPDPVIVDEDGIVSGVAHSVITGGITIDGGYLSAIRPSGVVDKLIGPTSAFSNPGSMAFDSSGRLLFADQTDLKVVAYDGNVVTTLFTVPSLPTGLAVDNQGLIYCGTGDGVVRQYDANGILLNATFITGFGSGGTITFGPGTTAWGSDLYNISGGILRRADANGAVTLVGTGFPNGDFTFGPGQSLYAGTVFGGTIWRVSPTTPDLDLPVMLGVDQPFVFAEAILPAGISFFADGQLAVGDGTNCDQVKVRLVSQDGSQVVPYGNSNINDPDAVFVDATGQHSGTVGALLVGGTITGTQGQITVVLPDQTTSVLWGPTSVFANPSNFVEDSTGRLLFGDASGGVFVSQNGSFPALLFSGPFGSPNITVDSNDNIYVAGADGVIRIYDSTGSLLNAAFATNVVSSSALAIAPACSALSGHIVTILDDESLAAIAPDGAQLALGTGFSDIVGLEFGPDCDLYMSQLFHDRVLRVTVSAGSAGIPTVSEWGIVVMSLFLLSAGTMVFMKRQPLAG